METTTNEGSGALTVSLMNGKVATVASLKEASAAVQREIDATGIGYHDWAETGAGIVRQQGEKMARVSYNGRLWDLVGFEIKEAV